MCVCVCVYNADPGPQDLLLWWQYANTHGLQKSCGGKRGCVAALQVRERDPDPCLDSLLLFFWAHYIEGDPHLPCIGSPQAITF